MQFLIDSYKRSGDLHHAYAFEGDAEIILGKLLSFFEDELKISIQGNPDYRFLQYESLGIDEARDIQTLQIRKSFSGGKKLYVIAIGGMTVEAQNALLKVFEEPTPETHFFLILDSYERLLPTLRSRIFFVSRIAGNESSFLKKGEEFLTSSIKERMSEVGAIAERISETGNRKEARELLDGIELSLSNLLKKQNTAEELFSLREVLQAKKYLEDRSPSVKILLEHIVHVTPILS